MAVDEAQRHQLYTSLEEQLGPEATATLMSLLPPVGWADVATKQDLTSLQNAIRIEIAEVRGEMADLRAQTTAEIAELRTETRTGLAELRTEMADGRADFHQELRSMQNRMIGAMFSLAGLTFAAVTLAG